MKIGFLSFRIAGTDGVSLEAARWRTILERLGHKVTFIAGELDRKGLLIPILHFTHPKSHRIHERVVDNNISYRKVEKQIFAVAGEIEGELRELLQSQKFDMFIVANVFSLPIHFPFAVALERVINEYQIPTIARNHDFWWERPRYRRSSCFDFFKKHFPPDGQLIKHAVINSIAQKELKNRYNYDSSIIPDCFDFDSHLNKIDRFNKDFKKDFKIKGDDLIFLQATRIVPRKQIELSIELVARLNNPKIVFILAGYQGDESGDYLSKLRHLARNSSIRLKYIGHRVNTRRGYTRDSKKIYTLWDCFVNSNFITYPSKIEGFGNQFIESLYFKKPILVNRYPVFKADIEPLGFQTITISNKITPKTISQVNHLLSNPDQIKNITNKNFKIAQSHFSYEATAQKIQKLL